MKKRIIVLGLLVGTAVIVSANGNGRNDGERQRQNVVAAEDCTLDEAGTGYLNEDGRKNQNQNNQTGDRQRQNTVDPEDCTLEEAGTGYLNEDGRKNQNQSDSNGRGRNRK